MTHEIIYSDKKFIINLHKNELVSSVIINSNNFFEINFLEFVKNNFNKQKTILDIGVT